MINPSKQDVLQVLDLGVRPYTEVLNRQFQIHASRLLGQVPDTVIVCEHQPVVTLGARADANRLRVDHQVLRARGIDVIQTNRGGGATAHNPGQLVIYPILNLRARGLTVSEYIRSLEALGVELLARIGLQACTRKGLPGIWIGDQKVGFIGVRVDRGVTLHGMAINISNDLGIFEAFVPCGLDGLVVTSVSQQLGRSYPVDHARAIMIGLLQKHWGSLGRLPGWLRRPLPAAGQFSQTKSILRELGLETVCVHANCPNKGQCWSRGTATVLILGPVCTRRCGFCSVGAGRPSAPDPTEPDRVAALADRLGLRYLVITSVTRDDLPDGGAGQFRDCVLEVRRRLPRMQFELLVPDFRGCQHEALMILRDAMPFVFAHNIETVPALYQKVRPGADYRRSLELLRMAKQLLGPIKTKSSIMLGLGETSQQVQLVLEDLRSVGCDRLTIGQYLRPSADHLDVVEYIRPEVFDAWRERALALGFEWVISEPFARSSYMADVAIVS